MKDATPLHLAVEGCHLEVAKLLASQEGVDLDATNNEVSGLNMSQWQVLT